MGKLSIICLAILGLTLPAFANAGNPLMTHHSVSRTTKHLFEVINTVYDDSTLTMEVRQYSKKSRSTYKLVTTMRIPLLNVEMQKIAQYLIFLANAPITQKNRIQKCTIQPNDPTSKYMATVRDFDPVTRRFYGELTTVDNDSKCWQSDVIRYSHEEDRLVANELRDFINGIAYLATSEYISEDLN